MFKWLKSLSSRSRQRLIYLLLGFFIVEMLSYTARMQDEVYVVFADKIGVLESQVLEAEACLLDVKKSYGESLQRIVTNLYEDETYGIGGLEDVMVQEIDDLFSAIMNATEDYRYLLETTENYFDIRKTYIENIPSVWPVKYDTTINITSGFGLRINPIYGVISFHKGIDIVGQWKTEVLATANGTVVSVWTDHRVYGKIIEIAHSAGFETLYAHLSKIQVWEGDSVERGQVIGIIGSTGQSMGRHLHYEVKKDGVLVNPIDYLSSSRTLLMGK